MGINKSSLILSVSSIINPLLGMANAIYNIASKGKINSFWLAFNISLMYVYMPLLWDTLSNFYYIKYFYSNESANFYQRILFTLSNKFNIEFIYIIFVFTLLISYLALKLVSYADSINIKYANRLKNKTTFFRGIFLIVFVLFLLDYRNLMDLQRFTVASYLSIYALTHLKSNITKSFVILLSIMLHSYTLAFSIIYFLLKKVNHKNTFILLLIVISLIGVLVVPLFTEYVIRNVSPRAYMYLTEVDLNERYSNKYSEIIIYTCRFSLVFFVMYIIIKIGDISNKNEIYRLTISSLIVFWILCNNAVFFERNFVYFSIVAALYLISLPLTKKQSLAAILFVGLNLGLNIVWMSSVVFTDKYNSIYKESSLRYELAAKPLFYPTGILINIDDYGYSESEIKNGTFIK